MKCERWESQPLRVDTPQWLEEYLEAVQTPNVKACEDCLYVCFFDEAEN